MNMYHGTYMYNCTCLYTAYKTKATRQSEATTPEDNSIFLKKQNELPQAGFEPIMFCVLGRRSTN